MAVTVNQNAFQIPNFNLTRLTFQDGTITPEAQRFFSTLTTSLQTIINTEGTFMYPQPTETINNLNTFQSIGAILYDSTINKFKGCELNKNTDPPTTIFRVFASTTSPTGILTADQGGTGVDNNGWQFTFNQDVSFMGGYDTIFNMVGDTDLNFPMSGTLSTTSEISSNNIAYYTMFGGL